MVGALWAVKYSQAEIWRHHQNRVRRGDSFLSLGKEKKGGARADVLARKKILAPPGPLRHGVRTGVSPPGGEAFSAAAGRDGEEFMQTLQMVLYFRTLKC